MIKLFALAVLGAALANAGVYSASKHVVLKPVQTATFPVVHPLKSQAAVFAGVKHAVLHPVQDATYPVRHPFKSLK